MPILPSVRRRLAGALIVVASALSLSPATAQLLPLSIQSTQPLSFGSFVSGTGGTITLTPSGGRSRTGGVVLVGQGGAFSAAHFTITGSPESSYSISLPADGVVQLTAGTQSMTVNAFSSDLNGTGLLPSTGSQTLRVGARLSVGSNQPPGQYQGTFTVTVNYQ